MPVTTRMTAGGGGDDGDKEEEEEDGGDEDDVGYKDDSDTVIMMTRACCASGPALGAGKAETAMTQRREIYVGCITAPTELSSLASKPKLMSTGFKYHAAVLTPLPEGPRAMGTSRDTILPQHLPRGP